MSTRDLEELMWARALEMIGRAERLQRQFFQPGRAGAVRAVWEPPVDVYESHDTIRILVALPGVAPSEVVVTVEDGAVTISGERRLPSGVRSAGTAIHRLEIPHGRFERRLPLPTRPLEVVGSELANGCLEILLRKI
ncbi:MAG: Hsp20/alpha crystallin family protein [Pseudomonadota bacterium]|nr:Hsp20/alpha crystallin family protein [Pseudomonadota bacterium]